MEFYFKAFGPSRERCQVMEMYRFDTGRKTVKSDNTVLQEVLEGQVDESVKRDNLEYTAWKTSIADTESKLIAAAKDEAFGKESIEVEPEKK